MNTVLSDRWNTLSANRRRTASLLIIVLVAAYYASNASSLAEAQADAPPVTESAVKESRYYRQQAEAAYRAKDYDACARHLARALSLIPDHPSILLSLARAQAMRGNKSESLRLLGSLARMKLFFPIEKLADFDPFKSSPEFAELLREFERNKAPVGRSTQAFSVREKGLIGEGLAYDPVTKRFFVSSVRKRKILSVAPEGEVTPFAAAGNGLWSVCGMRVDANRRVLWAATAATTQMEDPNKEDEGQSAILKFDLSTGKLLKKYLVPDRTKPHWLGDVALNSRGDVFATDSISSGLYVIRRDSNDIEMILDGHTWGSPQGMAFSDDGKHFFVADYSSGVYDVNLATKETTRLTPPSDTTLLGIDGLYFFKGSLIAVQNGVTPHRVVRLVLDKNLNVIQKVEIIESNNPVFEEPTLGVMVRDTFYFIANSQWDQIDDDGRIASPEKLHDLIVLRMRL